MATAQRFIEPRQRVRLAAFERHARAQPHRDRVTRRSLDHAVQRRRRARQIALAARFHRRFEQRLGRQGRSVLARSLALTAHRLAFSPRFTRLIPSRGSHRPCANTRASGKSQLVFDARRVPLDGHKMGE